MRARENKCQISQNDILHMKFSEVYLCFHNSCEIGHAFSRAPMRNSLWSLKKAKKNAMFFNLFWYKVFVHGELKLLIFLVDSVIITFPNMNLLK